MFANPFGWIPEVRKAPYKRAGGEESSQEILDTVEREGFGDMVRSVDVNMINVSGNSSGSAHDRMEVLRRVVRMEKLVRLCVETIWFLSDGGAALQSTFELLRSLPRRVKNMVLDITASCIHVDSFNVEEWDLSLPEGLDTLTLRLLGHSIGRDMRYPDVDIVDAVLGCENAKSIRNLGLTVSHYDEAIAAAPVMYDLRKYRHLKLEHFRFLQLFGVCDNGFFEQISETWPDLKSLIVFENHFPNTSSPIWDNHMLTSLKKLKKCRQIQLDVVFPNEIQIPRSHVSPNAIDLNSIFKSRYDATEQAATIMPSLKRILWKHTDRREVPMFFVFDIERQIIDDKEDVNVRPKPEEIWDALEEMEDIKLNDWDDTVKSIVFSMRPIEHPEWRFNRSKCESWLDWDMLFRGGARGVGVQTISSRSEI